MGKIENYTSEALKIARNPKHGYSQYNRWGNPDFDCSSLVCTVVDRAGIPVIKYGASYTGNMYRPFIRAGFIDVSNQVNRYTAKGLKRGDILLNTSKHVEIYTGNKKSVGAKMDEFGGIVGRYSGDQTGKEISEGSFYNGFNVVLRYKGNNSSINKTSSDKTYIVNKSSNQPKLIKYENGTATFKDTVNIRRYPNLNGRIVGQYHRNQSVRYDRVYEFAGYRWISYVGVSGYRNYIAYRRLTGNTTPWAWFK